MVRFVFKIVVFDSLELDSNHIPCQLSHRLGQEALGISRVIARIPVQDS